MYVPFIVKPALWAHVCFYLFFIYSFFFLEGVGGRGQLKTKYLMYFMWPCSVVIVYWTVPVLSWVPYLHVYLFIDA